MLVGTKEMYTCSFSIVMRISSVKPVSWLAVNLHHLLSDGAAITTQEP